MLRIIALFLAIIAFILSAVVLSKRKSVFTVAFFIVTTVAFLLTLYDTSRTLWFTFGLFMSNVNPSDAYYPGSAYPHDYPCFGIPVYSIIRDSRGARILHTELYSGCLGAVDLLSTLVSYVWLFFFWLHNRRNRVVDA